MRYEVDYVTLLMLAALLVWLRVEAALEGRRPARGAVRAAGGPGRVATAVLFGLAFSMTGYGDTLRLEQLPNLRPHPERVRLGPRPRGPAARRARVLEVGAAADPPPSPAMRLAAPGAGTSTCGRPSCANPALPRGSRIVVGGAGLGRRRPPVPRVDRGRFDVRAGFDGGGRPVRVRPLAPIGYRGAARRRRRRASRSSTSASSAGTGSEAARAPPPLTPRSPAACAAALALRARCSHGRVRRRGLQPSTSGPRYTQPGGQRTTTGCSPTPSWTGAPTSPVDAARRSCSRCSTTRTTPSQNAPYAAPRRVALRGALLPVLRPDAGRSWFTSRCGWSASRRDDALAAPLLASAGFLFALALMWFLIERYRPRTSACRRGSAAALVLGLANGVPFLLRRPAVYEVAIAGGYCCLLAVAAPDPDRGAAPRGRACGGWRAGASPSGLAVGAGRSCILAAPGAALGLVAGARRPSARGRRPRARSLRLAGRGAGAARGLPRAARSLQRRPVRLVDRVRRESTSSAGLNARELDRFDLGRLVPGLFFYLLAPPQPRTWPSPSRTSPPHYPGDAVDRLRRRDGAGRRRPRDDGAALRSRLAAPVLLLRPRAAPPRVDDAGVAARCWRRSWCCWCPLLSFDGATMRYEVELAHAGAARGAARLAADPGGRRAPRGGPRGGVHGGGRSRSSRAAFFGAGLLRDGLRRRPAAAQPADLRAPRERLRLGAHARARLRGEPVVLRGRGRRSPPTPRRS